MWISSIKAAHRDSTKRQPACPFMRIFSEKEKQSTMRSFQSRKYHFHFLMSQALPQVFFVQKETEHILRFDFDLFFLIIVVMMILSIWFTVILAGRGPHTVWMEESWVRLDDGRRLPQDWPDLGSHQSHQGYYDQGMLVVKYINCTINVVLTFQIWSCWALL